MDKRFRSRHVRAKADGRDKDDNARAMTKFSVEELQQENQQLRDLVISLSATLLRNVVSEGDKVRRTADNADAERLVREAEECFRCAHAPGLKPEVAVGLLAAGHELMGKAVKIETILERERRKR